MHDKKGGENTRALRSTLISYYTADEANNYAGVALDKEIYSYDPKDTGKAAPQIADTIIRNTGIRKGHHLSEIKQTQPDGRRYVYGIPAMNNVQREATYALPVGTGASGSGLVANISDSAHNGNGIDNYYSSTITPAYAHSYLLTAVLSKDYVDVHNDGVTDDDLGSYNKFNYTRMSKDYRWRAPL